MSSWPNSRFSSGLGEDTQAQQDHTPTHRSGNANTNGFARYSAMPADLHMPPLSEEPKVAHSARGMPERRLSISSNYSRASELLGGRDAVLGPRRPRPHKIWRKKYIKLLVVGDSGLGKTTLIRSLISIPGERLQVHDGSYTPTDQFLKDPDSLCSTISWRDEDDRTIWIYKIQDTPGYGDDLDIFKNLAMIQSYIETQNQKWLQMEQSRDRKEDMSELEDPRVDVCLFCIPPHRIRPVDLKYMYELSRYVPVVPIVTKADTMTIREANNYRQEVANKIANPMLPGIRDRINIFKFERDTLERAGVVDHATPVPPFLVVASNDINEELSSGENPLFWPERRYPWGTAEAFKPDHSDLLALRSLLLKEALEEISATKRQRYENWRRMVLSRFNFGKKIRNALLWTIVPAIICLQIGRSGMHIRDVRRSFRTKVNQVRSTWGKVRDRIGGKPSTPAPVAPAPAPVPAPVAPPPPPPAPAPAPPKKSWGF